MKERLLELPVAAAILNIAAVRVYQLELLEQPRSEVLSSPLDLQSCCYSTNCAVTAHVSATIHEEYAEISFLIARLNSSTEHIVVSTRLEHEAVLR